MSNQVGRPKGSEFTVLKAIRITEEMNKKWNPNKIRDFLSNGHSEKHSDTTEHLRSIYKTITGKSHRGSKEELENKLFKIKKIARGL